MLQLLIGTVLLMILAWGVIAMREMPKSKGRPRKQVMFLVDYRPTRDTGFGG